MKKLLFIVLALFMAQVAFPQQSPKKKTTKKTYSKSRKGRSPKEVFAQTKTGLRYKHYVKKQGKKAQLNDIIVMQYVMKVRAGGRDSILRNTFKEPMPFAVKVMPPTYKGSIEEGFVLLAKGDSAAFLVKADSLFKGNFPDFIDKASDVRFDIRVLDITTEQAYTEARQKEMEAQVATQKVKDDALIIEYLQKNNITNYKKTASGLYYVIAQEGTGETLTTGTKVSVHYSGKLLDGTKFDASYDRGEPLSFGYNKGQMIKGFDEGVGFLKKGGKATLFIPSHLGYGSRAAGTIPPFSVLVFDIELVEAVSEQAEAAQNAAQMAKEEAQILDYLKKNNITNYQKTGSGLYYTIQQEGNGEALTTGKKVYVHYLGRLLDGTKFDSSYDRGTPLDFSYNAGQMIKGFDEGVGFLKKGGKATLFIPSVLGYGDRATGSIPPNSVLLFDIELVNIE